jgi:uncharacterized protein YjdB
MKNMLIFLRNAAGFKLLPNKIQNAKLLFLIASLGLFIFSGCPNPIQYASWTDDAQTGTISLIIAQGSARAIMPSVGLDDFDRFEFTFTPGTGVPAGIQAYTKSVNDTSAPINIMLAAGTWHLVATAFIGELIVARSVGQDVIITAGQNIGAQVLLRPIPEGTGTFRWNINFPEIVSEADIEVWDALEGNKTAATPVRTMTLTIDNEGISKGYIYDLPSGEYIVVFKLRSTGDENMEIVEALHIYQNLDSIFTGAHIFDDYFAFPISLFARIRNAWDGTAWDFVDAGISWRHFDLLGIKGISAGNFPGDIQKWFNELTTPANVPTTLVELKALVDAALVGIGSESEDLFGDILDTDNWYRAAVEEAIRMSDFFALNSTPITFEWATDGYILTIYAGAYGVEISFITAVPLLFINEDGNAIVSGTDLATQLAWLRSFAKDGGRYLIRIAQDELTAVALTLPADRINLVITIIGIGGERFIQRTVSDTTFVVPTGVTLVLGENITLMGRGPNAVPARASNFNPIMLVDNGGTFVMNAGSRVTGNTNSAWHGQNSGGGVWVHSGGTFILNGGEISRNNTTATSEAGQGGGVRVEAGGRFYMLDGKIWGNAGQLGGGVRVNAADGIFRMVSGVIYGDEMAVDSYLFPNTRRNTTRDTTANRGAAMSHVGSAVNRQRGTFSGTFDGITIGSLGEWNSVGDFAASENNTIRLLNGVGVPSEVVVSPETIYIAMGGTRRFVATSVGFFSPVIQTVNWSLSTLGTHAQTSITAEGVLTIAAGENLSTLTVRATSTVDSNVYGEAIVIIVSNEDDNLPVPGFDLATQLAWLRTWAESGSNYVVRITQDEAIPGGTANNVHSTLTLPAGRTDLSITIVGIGEERVIRRAATAGVTFNIPSGVTLILGENITLMGRGANATPQTADNTRSVVSVGNGGTFVMNEGSKVTGNTNTETGSSMTGAGVRVNSGGIFILNGGEISRNSAPFAQMMGGVITNSGGVYVVDGGSFYMLDGNIWGNEASFGGGVEVTANGVFRMVSGVIYGNTARGAPEEHANLSRTGNGAALRVPNTVSANHQRGVFEGTFDGFTAASLGNWTANGNFTGATNRTIRLKNGLLYPLQEEIGRDANGNIIVPGTCLDTQLNWLWFEAKSDERYIIWITQNEAIPGNNGLPSSILSPFNHAIELPVGRTNLTITFVGIGGERIIQRADSGGTTVAVPNGVTLILGENITFMGRGPNATPVTANNDNNIVRVFNGGTFIMNEGSRVTGNTNTTTSVDNDGGGVRVFSNGLFILNGGEISQNTDSWSGGGGVRVEGGGMFYLLDGAIWGNVGQSGGGVRVTAADGIFRMVSGVIYGDEAWVPAVHRNTSRNTDVNRGAALSIVGAGVNHQRGTFANAFDGFTAASLGAWTPVGNFAAAENDTINVLNGVRNIQDITWIATPTGSPTTTAINFTFSADPGALLTTDITITSGTGSATRGALTGTGTTRALAVSNVSAGTVYVSINRAGIASGPQTVMLIVPPQSVSFDSVTANGSSTQTTTQLTLTFSQVINGLNVNDITLSGISGANNITKILDGTGPVYTMTIGNVIVGGNLNVAVAKTGFDIIGSPRTVIIHHYAAVTGISLNLTSTSIVPGNTRTLIPAIMPSNATNRNVTWSSSNNNIATVSTNGIVTGISPGSATITATTVEGGFQAACNVTISDFQNDHLFNVSNAIQWENAVNTIRSAGNNRTWRINITNAITIAGNTTSTPTFGNITGVQVTITGDGGDISLNSAGEVLNIGPDQTVIINNLSVTGLRRWAQNVGWSGGPNLYSLVSINGSNANFIMRGTSRVIDNNRQISGQFAGTTAQGGGIYIRSGGILTMQDDSSVGGNLAFSGGGVYVAAGATFNMRNRATIAGNWNTFTANVSIHGPGGGVFVAGIFNMEGGTIRSNNSRDGGGVYVAQGGTFNMIGGTIEWNSAEISGGGVSNFRGTFIMSGGIIFGDDNNARNQVELQPDNGSVLFNSGGTARYGNGQNILPHTDGNNSLTNRTITGRP